MEIYGEYDVVVVGGGTSGVAAAICAARAGANTILIERLGTLGGQMNVSGPPGFAYAYMFNPRCEQIIGGIMEETHNRLLKEGHALPHTTPDFRVGYSFSLVDPDYWGLLVFEMMTENNVNLLLHSLAVDVLKEGNAIKGIVVENASGRQAVLGKVIIDCTGEGHVSARAGAPYEQVPKEELEPHTISFAVDGVNWDKVLQYVKDNAEYEFNAMTHPYLNWTQEQIVERIRKVKDITEITNFMGYYSLRDKALAAGEWHPYSGVGFFIMPRDKGVFQALFQHSSQVGNVDPTDVTGPDLLRNRVPEAGGHGAEIHQQIYARIRKCLSHAHVFGAENTREPAHYGRLHPEKGRRRRSPKIQGRHREELLFIRRQTRGDERYHCL